MKRLFSLLCLIAFFAACSGKSVPPGMYMFRIDKKFDIKVDRARVARISFKLNKSGDCLFVHIYTPWQGDMDKEVLYEVTLYDNEQKVIQSKTHKTSRKYNNVSMSLNMVDKSNVGDVCYFSFKLSE